MTLIMLCGSIWRIAEPAGLSAMGTREVLTSVVYYFLLPAMILDVLWQADLGQQTLAYSLLGSGAIAAGILLSYIAAKLGRFAPAQTGTVILAAAFANVTYLGLPVLEQTFGLWARSVAIQIDLFAAAPLVFSVGIMIARHFGAEHGQLKPLWTFLNAPPFWAGLLAAALNLNQIAEPLWLSGLLQKLAATVSPLMLFALGLALDWRSLRWRNLPFVLPVVLIKLVLLPWLIAQAVPHVGLDIAHQQAAVIDLAMPSMVVGIILCDRYRLDSSLYAMAVTVTTALSLVSLPFWYGWLNA